MKNNCVKEMYVIDGGYMDVDKGLMTAGVDQGKMIEIPVPVLLLSTTEGYVLLDTGVNPIVITDPVSVWGEFLTNASMPHVEDKNDIRVVLKDMGIAFTDVKYVINTHMHHDHLGGNRFFPDATHIVQKDEYRFARYPDDAFSSRYKLDTDLDGAQLNWQLVEGEAEILPGISLVPTFGHSPGHQSVLLHDLPGIGPLIYCGDAVYLKENWAEDIGPGICWNPPLALASMHKLKQIASLIDAYVFVSHDIDYFRALPHAPEKFHI
jgi:glyoxylase-like metal-dependent hydrolase (beta-lactamase superfamily II)